MLTTVSYMLPGAFDCTTARNCTRATSTTHMYHGNDYYACDNGKAQSAVAYYAQLRCPKAEPNADGTFTVHYKDMGSLTTQPGAKALSTLFTRATPDHISYGACIAMLVFCFCGACIAAGSAVSAGIIIPVFIIGACFGTPLWRCRVASFAPTFALSFRGVLLAVRYVLPHEIR